MKTVLYCRVSTVDKHSIINEPRPTRMDLNLIWCLRTMACRASQRAFVNVQKGGDFSTFYARVTRWSSGGWIASDAITKT